MVQEIAHDMPHLNGILKMDKKKPTGNPDRLGMLYRLTEGDDYIVLNL